MDILIVEDDKKIGEELCSQLDLLGYKTKRALDFSKVLEEFKKDDYKLVLLDLKLPYKNGFYWCKKIREISKVPIIFLTSAADDINLITAINYGADDFLAKPFSMQILDSKIRALLRRAYDFKLNDKKILTYEGIILDTNKMTLEKGDKIISLSKNEYLIMDLLFKTPGEVVSRDKIMDRLWSTDSFIDDNTLTVNINRIRKKIKSLDLENFIYTKKGVGYYIK